MKKFMNKLESKLDGNSSRSSSTQQPARPPQQTYGQPSQYPGGYAQPSGPPPGQQQQFQQPQQYGQQPFSQPAGPPPGHFGSAPPQPARGGEDAFAALRRYDTIFLVDDSESMEMFWYESLTQSMVGVVEKAVQYDEDGIDIYFFNSQVVMENVRTAQDIRNLFRRVEPRKSTPTAKALKRVLEPYLLKLEAAHRAKEMGQSGQPVKPLNLVVLTDGAPDRGEDPEGVIVDAGKRLDAIRAPPYQLGFSFVQIGADEEAQAALTYLDDHLKTEYNIRDMVDTTLTPPNGQVSSDYLLKALLGGINRKLDKQN